MSPYSEMCLLDYYLAAIIFAYYQDNTYTVALIILEVLK